MTGGDRGPGSSLESAADRTASLSALVLLALLPFACWTRLMDCFPLPKLLALIMFGLLIFLLGRPGKPVSSSFRWVPFFTVWIAAGACLKTGTLLSPWRAWPEAALLVLPALATVWVPPKLGARRAVDAFLVAAVAVAAYGLSQAAGWEPGKWISPFHKGVASTIGNPDLLGGFLVLPFALSCARVLASPGWLNGGAVALLGAALLATEARAAWLAGATAIGLLFPFASRRAIIVAAAAVAWGLAFLFILHPTALGNMFSGAAFKERVWTWKIGGRALREAPATGYGAGSFRSVYLDYQARGRDRGEEYFHYTEYAHNEPVHLAVETGVVGLGLALWAAVCLISAWRSSVLRSRDPVLWRGLGAGGAGFLVNSLLSFPLHIPPTAVSLALLLGVAAGRGHRQGWRAEGSSLPVMLIVLVALAAALVLPFRLAYVSAALYDGQAKALAGSPDEARAQYASALKLMPRDVRLHWYAAAAAQMSKDFDSALAHSDAAIQEEPGMSDVWYTRGVILKAAGRDGDAEKAYRTALRLNPGAAMAWNNLGNLLGIRGRFREAEQAQRRALRFDPALKEARQNLAITLLMLKRSEEARRIMEGGQP